MVYNFTAQWLKGNKNEAPDALSCHPVSDPESPDMLAEMDINDHSELSFAELRVLHGNTESLSLQDL